MKRFEGRVAIVTGAARGLGAAIAKRLGAEGATVCAVDINGPGAEATAAEIGGDSFAEHCDVGDPAAVEGLHGAVMGRAGQLDVLVNAAAIVPFVPWDELTFDEWRRIMRVNLDGLYLMCRASSEMMRLKRYGRIVNISSNSIFAGTPNMAHYVASKGGVFTFTRRWRPSSAATRSPPIASARAHRHRGDARKRPQGGLRLRRDAAGQEGPRRPRACRPCGRLPGLGRGPLGDRPGARRRRRHDPLVGRAMRLQLATWQEVEAISRPRAPSSCRSARRSSTAPTA